MPKKDLLEAHDQAEGGLKLHKSRPRNASLALKLERIKSSLKVETRLKVLSLNSRTQKNPKINIWHGTYIPI